MLVVNTIHHLSKWLMTGGRGFWYRRDFRCRRDFLYRRDFRCRRDFLYRRDFLFNQSCYHDSRFWWFWQVVLMVLMLLTVGFDDFDRWFWWFWCFDSRFWWFWCFDSRFWCFWWFWQVVFVFEGCIINDSRFWCFWWFWQLVLMFWQQVLMFLMILTEGFCFWRLYFKSCYHDSRFCPLKTLLSGNSPPTHSSVSGSVLWKTVKTVHSCEQKLIVYKIAY